jgi:hypothetical protein
MPTNYILHQKMGYGLGLLVRYWIRLNPFREVVEKHYKILVPTGSERELMNINPHTMKRSTNGYGLEKRTDSMSWSLSTCTTQTSTTKSSNISSHTRPPVQSTQTIINFSLRKMASIYGRMIFDQQLLSPGLWNYDTPSTRVRRIFTVQHTINNFHSSTLQNYPLGNTIILGQGTTLQISEI